ncbi:MAG TPA: sensor histidine kinase [Spirochaetia bacterium]|nr:sensor histidine kinase [Spirochaetia bacterium]
MFEIRTGRRGTLKKQIVFLLVWFFLAILGMQAFFFGAYYTTNRRDYSSLVRDTTEQLGNAADNLAVRLSRISSLLTFNYNTARLFGSESLSTKLQLLRSLQLTIDSVRSSNASIDQIALTDFHELCLGDCNDSLFRVLPEVQSRIPAAGLATARDALYMQVIDPADRSVRFVRVSHTPTTAPASEDFYTIIVFNVSSLLRSVSSGAGSIGSYYLYPNDSPNPMYVGGRRVDSESSLLGSTLDLGKTGFHNSAGRIAYAREVKALNWYIVGTLRTNLIWNQMAAVQLPNLLMMGIVMTLLFVEGWLIVRSITGPIAHMASFMKLVGNGDNTRRLEVRHTNEIGLLANDINAMLNKIEHMAASEVETRQLLYQTRLAKQQAELSAFQSQVNPHFLYNTLDCVRSMALMQNLPEIGKIASAMVHMFRYSVKESDQVRLRDEIGCIQQYLTIIQIRQSNRLAIRYEVDDEALDAIIPKMVLQPLVENAVIHGLDHVRGGGSLTIRGKVFQKSPLVLEVEDSGAGMSDDKLEELRQALASALGDGFEELRTETKSIGLVNIDRRLKLTYGSEFGLQIFHAAERGVLARISVPFSLGAVSVVAPSAG